MATNRSLWRGSHSSGTPVARRLVQPTRTTHVEPWWASPRVVPIRSCSRWGLPCHACYQPCGGLLPHPFTLTCTKRASGLLSVALSLGSPPPDVIRHRFSVEPGLSSARTFRHRNAAAARPTGRLLPSRRDFKWQAIRTHQASRTHQESRLKGQSLR